MPVFRPDHSRGRVARDGHAMVHSFSSAGWVDRAWMGFGALRVLAGECIGPQVALPPQRRANMQILTWVRCGVLAWRDGDVSGELHAGCVQLLDSGHGIDQAEHNPSPEHPVELVRLWLQPQQLNVEPRRHQLRLDAAGRDGQWQRLAGGDTAAGEAGQDALPLRLDAQVSVARLRPGEALAAGAQRGRRLWLQLLHGHVTVGDQALAAGDAMAWEGEDDPRAVVIAPERPAEILRVELPG